MDEDEPVPGTSKQNVEERSEVSNKHSNSEVGKDGNGTASDTSVSVSNSDNSHIEMGHERMGNKAPISRKDCKPKERKKIQRRPVGRVAKRPRRVEAKKLVRRRSRRAIRERRRRFSVSTVFTKLSGAEPTVENCPYCGHRCCNRRYYSYNRSYNRKLRKKFRKNRERRIRNYSPRMRKLKAQKRNMGTRPTFKRKTLKQCVQVGSRCLMLSPLCVNSGPPLPGPSDEEANPLRSCEITPQMIIQTLRRLSMFRAAVEINSILEYLKRNFPVGCDAKLADELAWKLHIATRVGIVRQPSPGKWTLTCALMRRKLDKNHVTLFWDLYRNSLRPVKKAAPAIQEDSEIT